MLNTIQAAIVHTYKCDRLEKAFPAFTQAHSLCGIFIEALGLLRTRFRNDSLSLNLSFC